MLTNIPMKFNECMSQQKNIVTELDVAYATIIIVPGYNIDGENIAKEHVF